MIQRTYDPENEEQFAWMIASLKDPTLYAENRAVFIQLFFSRFTESEASRVLDFMREELPKAKIAGMSLYGDSIVELNTKKFIRLNICQFDESDTAVFEYDSSKQTAAEIAAAFKKELASIENARGVLIFTSGLTFNISHFMESATEGSKNIPFFGAVGNINTADSKEDNPFVLARHTFKQGVVAVVFYGKNLYFFTEQQFGWKPIGKQFAVESEEATVIGDTHVTKIDGKPATEIYKRYLDVDPDRHFIANICEFPLVVERDGAILPRIPCGFNSKGEINIMGDIKNGETVRFTYGKTDEILKEAYDASSRMSGFLPQGIFLYVCANRAVFMKERAWEEIDFFSKISPNLLYCHGFSELYRFKGKGGVFNSSLICVGLREGNREACSVAWHNILPKGIVSFDLKKEDNKNLTPFDNMTIAEDQFAKKVWLNAYLTEEAREAFVSPPSIFEQPIGKSIPLSDRLVTFLEATTKDLALATEEAKSASKAKSDFLSNMSHEIRTPINAVLGLDEMILRESDEANIKNYARDIQSAGRALLSIINDILDFSKIEAGKMEIINAPYDLRQIINDLNNMIASRAESKGLEFFIDVDETIPHLLYGDEVRVQQCALNILTNAVKYTRKGRVILSVGAQESAKPDEIELCFAIHDTGIGIKSEDLSRLTSPFERIEENRNRSVEGTGLGMSIVNGLLQKMGSSLIVQSEYGVGSSFSFAVKQKVLSPERIGTYAESRAALAAVADTYTESFQAPTAQILVIDDTPMNISVFRGLLKATHCKIDSAESADDGLRLTRNKKYDILFIDHLMPKKDGIAFLRELRAESGNENAHGVCIALTANAVSGAREMYLEAGFDGYLTKPIDSKSLEATIAENIPKEKVLHKGDVGYSDEEPKWKNGVERRQKNDDSALECLFREMFSLNFRVALTNCGSIDTFKTAVASFYEAIDETAQTIEQSFAANDWDTFTIKVHALKSSARLIGAEELSEKARILEAEGDARRAHASALTPKEIEKTTQELLTLYREYAKNLRPLLFRNEEEKEKSAVNKPLLSDAEFLEGVKAIKTAAQAADFDTADAIIEEMDKYKISEAYRAKYSALRCAVRDVDALQISSIDIK